MFYHTSVITYDINGHHALAGLFEWGGKGVSLFFVLSGFIMMYIHRSDFGQSSTIPSFFSKRFFRIYPSVVFLSLLSLAFYSKLDTYGHDYKLSSLNITRSILLIPQPDKPLIGVAWTLQYEMLFYILFSTLLLNLRLGLAVMTTWQLGVLAANLVYSDYAFPWSFFFSPLNHQFLLGMGIGYLVQQPAMADRIGRKLALVLALSGFLMFAGFGSYEHAINTQYYMDPCAVGAAVMLFGLFFCERYFRHAPYLLLLLGEASYSIYLVHYSVIKVFLNLVHKLLPAMSLSLWAGVAVIVATVTGILFSRYVERPIASWGRRLSVKKVAPSPTT